MMNRLAFLLGLFLVSPVHAQQIFTGSAGLSVASGAFTCTSAGVCTLNPISAIATSLAIGGCAIGANAACVTGPVAFGAGTITTSQPVSITQTWNAAVTFTGIQANIIDTSSNGGSLLVDLQKGGTSQFTIGKTGITSGNTIQYTAFSSFTNLASAVAGTTSNRGGYFDNTRMVLASGAFIGFSSNSAGTGDVFSSADVMFSRNAAGVTQVGTTTANSLGTLLANTLRTNGFTVATLPTVGVAGRRAYITDQLTACVATGLAITGGGVVVCPVFDNGVAWVGG